ncbi:AGAP008193-PA-like protein [Anopheles sinensis]|uniref:AGAP008193-PA-like protein n=1 Tax=Anopheles sinensis TaxID=74873 RepID=A0A084VXQ7_ANOSI|nr:AGAP008193-PA-like protein [Anopheles sinensis]
MFCAAGKTNVSACSGDSGGGMFFNTDGTWYLRGIVSTIPSTTFDGRPVCDYTKYTVFTDVSKFRNWILRYTNPAKWLKELKPCLDDADTGCNAGRRHGYDFFIVFRRFSINLVPLNARQSTTNVDTDGWGLHFNYDCTKGQMYWTRHLGANIYSTNYNGADHRTLIIQGLQPTTLAVDWISRRLYWGDREKQTIEVASIENIHVRTVLLDDEMPWSMAVDPHLGKLYWTIATSKGYSIIKSCNLDGSDRKEFVKRQSESQRFIVGIKVSMATGELCYFYEETNQIECIDTRTKRTRTVASNIYHRTYFSVTDELFYWAEYNGNKIESIDDHGVRQKPINIGSSDEINEIEMVSGNCPMFYSQCAVNNGGCRKNTICLLSPRDSSGITCKKIET